MSEHHFTDENATVVVLNSLVKDMHHALVQVEILYGSVAGFFVGLTGLGLIDGEWNWLGIFPALAAAWFFLLADATRRRRRKYRPGKEAST